MEILQANILQMTITAPNLIIALDKTTSFSCKEFVCYELRTFDILDEKTEKPTGEQKLIPCVDLTNGKTLELTDDQNKTFRRFYNILNLASTHLFEALDTLNLQVLAQKAQQPAQLPAGDPAAT